ncbi:APC family permease [Pasteurella atlantica]|uniref:APC family permease n=2 Tax=Pasteurellaceae TaxID=712 RepID=A0ACC6HN41_9PAST|nr:APC family permease [Pasteurella atlantica]MDP8052296.1 APC family permease [Pasteurella atlantica]MDP8101765.1 APC family permease [Pasteurella atlantica]MDP8105794.1 APC family permease [Pasteurella atlantica]MDP8149141.1 APC family permease [Pasteurella atlantica]
MSKQKLSKNLSSLSVLALAFGCIIGWGAFVLPGSRILIKSGPLGATIGFIIATFVIMVIALNYNYMIKKFPSAGGSFKYTQEALGSTNAFVCAWFLSLTYITLIPLNATALALITRSLLDNVFQFGFQYELAGYTVYLGEVILAIVAVILFAVLSIKNTKLTGNFQILLTILLLLGVLIILLTAIVSDKASLDNLQPYFSPETSIIGGVLSVIVIAPWAFIGFDTVPQASEEFNFSVSKTRNILILSISFGAFVYIALNLVTAMVVPNGYGNWIEYIKDVDNLSGIKSLPTFYATYSLLENTGLVFLGLSVLAAILSGLIGFYMASSRLLYAMAKNNVIPSWFGKLDKKYNTPTNAILFIMFFSIITPFFGRNALMWLVDMASIGAAIGYGYTSLAALKYAWQDKEIFTMITGVLGSLFSLFFIVVLVVPIKELNISLGKESYVALLCWVITGVLFYMRKNRKIL